MLTNVCPQIRDRARCHDTSDKNFKFTVCIRLLRLKALSNISFPISDDQASVFAEMKDQQNYSWWRYVIVVL